MAQFLLEQYLNIQIRYVACHKTAIYYLLRNCTNIANAQLVDNFTDGNFTASPIWLGNTADWIVNPTLQLQSNNTIASSTFFLSTASTMATTAQWDFFTNLTFNTSSTNYVDVFLTASASDLSLNTTTGYFVRIGNTTDEICLYKKDATGTITKINVTILRVYCSVLFVIFELI